MRVLFVADYFRDPVGESRGLAGGAEQTDAAVIDACPWPIERVPIERLDERTLDGFELFLLGNLSLATREQCEAIARRGRHVLFEHDYRMCRYRGNYQLGDRKHRWLGICLCREPRFAGLFESALGAIFLTRRQLARYRANPYFRLPPHEILGCSVMGTEFFQAVRRAREQSVERRGTVVVHSDQVFKGFSDSLAYCERRGIEPTILRDAAPADVLETLARAERLVFLPRWVEPASRLAVEARFLGCQVVSNRRLGVAGEPWWREPDAVGLSVLESAARRFWEIVGRFARAPVPNRAAPPLAAVGEVARH